MVPLELGRQSAHTGLEPCRYRFDDRESATCAMSNATAIDASYGGEEWLCLEPEPRTSLKMSLR